MVKTDLLPALQLHSILVVVLLGGASQFQITIVGTNDTAVLSIEVIWGEATKALN